MKKLILRRVLFGLAVPVAITGTRALADRLQAREGSHAAALHRVGAVLQRVPGVKRSPARSGR